MNRYVCIKTYLYITRDFSSSLAIEMYGRPFFPCHPYIESTTVLSDKEYRQLMNDHGSDDDFQEDSFCTAPKTKKPCLCTSEEAIFEDNNHDSHNNSPRIDNLDKRLTDVEMQLRSI